MRERKTGRLLALLLVAALLLSLLPATVLAVDTGAATTSNDDSFMRIVHLDCGRKYFSVKWVKSLIDEMAKNGYTHLELAFGNDGLRFLLDDMSVTVGDTTYDSVDVTNAIKAGNDAYDRSLVTPYEPGETEEWAEEQMDEILQYAKDNKISIIPLLNTPGHMDAIVYAMGQLEISDAAFKPYDTASVRTVSLTSDQAVAFTQALVKKYVDYFAVQGCKYFNLGADEYGNDVLTDYGMGFGYLSRTEKYGTFVDYVNTLAGYVTLKDMTPIVFNDGVCYGDNTSDLINNNVLVSYWTSGWPGYDVASAESLAGKGYSLINTHGDFYYILGKDDAWDSGSTTKAGTWNNTSFIGESTIDSPAGSMFCIWCDFPGAEIEEVISNKVIDTGILSAMAKAMGADVQEPTDPDTGDGDSPAKTEEITVAIGSSVEKKLEGVNYAGEYDTADPGIATVTVTGQDATEGSVKYQSVSASCHDLISTDSDDWKAANGYYYTPDDGANYYPVYAKRTTQGALWWKEYKYTWGYSTDGGSEVITINSAPQTTDTTTEKANITVYTRSEVPATSASTTITFYGHSAGITDVTIGDTKYIITVPQEDLSEARSLTIEYWITNRPVTANGNTTMTVTAQEAYGKDGVVIADLVPMTGTSSGNDMDYWKSTKLDPSHQQTTDGGVDQTLNGYDFTYVRYYNGNWAVSSNGSEWETVLNTDQIVAYYLQRTDVTNEVTTQVVDWGPVYSNWSDINGNGKNYVLLDYTVQYENGYEVPSTFPNNKSLAFHCDTPNVRNRYRTLGMIRAQETADYEVYLITVTPTSDSENTRLSERNAASNHSYKYDGTETVAWAATDTDLNNSGLGRYTSITDRFECIVGGDPIVSGLEIYRAHGMKVTYYVRAKATPDSLTVNYVDLSDKTTFYTYNIAVNQDTTFNPGFALQDGKLINSTVTNSLGNPITVSTDLRTLSQIGAQYLNSQYECQSVELSDDYKTVTLYYRFDHTHSFVVDFGLPLVITAEDLGIDVSALNGATVNVTTGGGTASIASNQITFTPTKVLTGRETINLTMYDADKPYSHQIYIYPASNVLYEETFFDVTTDYSVPAYNQIEWTDKPATSIPTQSAAQNTLYGYDAAYSSSTGDSLGSHLTVNVPTSAVGSKILATTFYGNGFDLIGTAGPNTGYVYLLLGKHGADGKIASVDAIVIDTSYVQKDDNDKYITLHQVPLAHKEYEEDATYTAYVYAAYRAQSEGDTASQANASTFSLMSASSPLDEIYAVLAEFEAAGLVINDIEFVSVDENSVLSESADAQVSLFFVPATDSDTDTSAAKSALARPAGTTVTIDGFRVYRKAIGSDFADAYKQADENNFKYINILKATLTGDNGSDFTSFAYVEGSEGEYTQATYEASGGPQNELYLKPGSGVVIYVDGNGAAQFSARAVTNSCAFTVSVVDGQTNSYTAVHNTELYYAAPGTGVITVVNNSKTDMLALGNLKVLGGATVRTLSAEDVQAACLMLASAFPVDPGDTEEPGDIEEPEVPVEPETPAVFEPAKLDVKVNSTKVLFNKLVTVTVSASADVDKLTINGKTLYPTNSLLVQWGLSKTYTYIYVDTVKRTESKSYEIVAYNDAGVASAPVTVQG